MGPHRTPDKDALIQQHEETIGELRAELKSAKKAKRREWKMPKVRRPKWLRLPRDGDEWGGVVLVALVIALVVGAVFAVKDCNEKKARDLANTPTQEQCVSGETADLCIPATIQPRGPHTCKCLSNQWGTDITWRHNAN
jgi:hypothetical protein